MEKLREAMSVFLMNLPKRCIFNIYSFGSKLTPLWLKSMPNSQETIEAAKQHISSFNADMGSKMILPILNCIVEQRLGLDASTTQVILLTDGEVQNAEEIANFVAKAVRASKGALRFFPLGIGYANSRRLVEGIRQQNGGFGEVIVLDRQEQLVGIVTRILEGALSPWKFEISLSGHFKSGVTSSGMQVVEHPASFSFPRTAYIQAPYFIHSLNPFAWSTIFFLFHDKQNIPPQIVTIKVTTVSGNFEYKDIRVDYAQIKSSTIHQVGAKSIMVDLEAGQSWTHMAAYESDVSKSQEPISNLAIGKEAECIGLKWSIAGKWTSFVAVDRNNEGNIAWFYRASRSEQGLSSAVGKAKENNGKKGRESVEMKAEEKAMPKQPMGHSRTRFWHNPAGRAPLPPPNSLGLGHRGSPPGPPPPGHRLGPPPPPSNWAGGPPWQPEPPAIVNPTRNPQRDYIRRRAMSRTKRLGKEVLGWMAGQSKKAKRTRKSGLVASWFTMASMDRKKTFIKDKADHSGMIFPWNVKKNNIGIAGEKKDFTENVLVSGQGEIQGHNIPTRCIDIISAQLYENKTPNELVLLSKSNECEGRGGNRDLKHIRWVYVHFIHSIDESFIGASQELVLT